MASGGMCRANRSDAWPHQPALQRRSKNPCQWGAVHTGHYGQRRYVPRKQVGHMAAPTSVAEALKKPLPMGGRPHMRQMLMVGAIAVIRYAQRNSARRPRRGESFYLSMFARVSWSAAGDTRNMPV